MPDRMKQGRTPDTVFMLAGLAVGGAFLTAAGYVPGSVQFITPAWGGVLWGAVLSLSATLSLLGVLWRNPVTGWALEVSGRPGVALTCIGYAGALAHRLDEDFGAGLAVVLFGAFGLASLFRTYRLVHHLAAFREAVGELHRRRHS